jgi:hypothetical protein
MMTTKIDQGDWRLEIHQSPRGGAGYRRYHRHKNTWYCVIASPDTLGGVTPASGGGGCGYVCIDCDEPVPEEMEGYINLARYALDAD